MSREYKPLPFTNEQQGNLAVKASKMVNQVLAGVCGAETFKQKIEQGELTILVEWKPIPAQARE